MADEAPEPNSPADMAARSEARIAKMRGDDPSKVKDVKGEEATKAGASDGNDAAAATGKTPETPDGGSDPNLSHIPEKYRSTVASIPPELRDSFIEWTRGGTVRHADVVKFKKEAEEARKELTAAKAKVAAWDDFASDRRRVEALLAYDKKLKAGAAKDAGVEVSEDDVPDFPNMTAKEIEAHIRKVAAKAAAEAAEQARTTALKEFEEKYVSPAASTHAANLALAQYAKENGYTPDQIQEAVNKALAWGESLGVTKESVTADNVVALIEPFVPSSAGTAKPTNGAATRNGAGVATLSRGGAAVAPSPVPAWEREQRPPNRSERLGAIASTIEKMYGKRVTESQIGDALAHR